MKKVKYSAQGQGVNKRQRFDSRQPHTCLYSHITWPQKKCPVGGCFLASQAPLPIHYQCRESSGIVRLAKSRHSLYVEADNTDDLSEKLGMLLRNTWGVTNKWKIWIQDSRLLATRPFSPSLPRWGLLQKFPRPSGIWRDLSVSQTLPCFYTHCSELRVIASGRRSGGICWGGLWWLSLGGRPQGQPCLRGSSGRQREAWASLCPAFSWHVFREQDLYWTLGDRHGMWAKGTLA